MTTAPFPFRNRFAAEYQSAPLRRFNAQAVVVDTGSAVEITGQFPTQAQLGDASYCNLMASFLGAVEGLPLEDAHKASIVVTDDPAVLNPCYPYTGEEETDGIRTRHHFARVGNFLVAPDGTQNQVFCRNDGPNEISFLCVWEIPTLDWRLVIPNEPEISERQRWAIEYEAAPGPSLNNEAVIVGAGATVEITDRIPLGGPTLQRSPSVDLFVTYAPTDPALPLVVVVGAAGATGGYLPTPGTLLADPGGAGMLATNRVRKLLPRDPATGTTLLDGSRVFLANMDPGNLVNATVFVRPPSLNWR